MSENTKLEDAYDDFVADTSVEIAGAPEDYIHGYRDGAYDFFASLLGEPDA